MDQIYTILLNESIDASLADPTCGCPVCTAYRRLQENELERILGGAMMEPDIRIRTNKEGFCSKHFAMLLGRKNRLGLALMMESHLAEVSRMATDGPLSSKGSGPVKELGRLENSCYICHRLEDALRSLIGVAVYLYESDETFRTRFAALPHLCLPHYRLLIEYAQKKMNKKNFAVLYKTASEMQLRALSILGEDVSWFCKKFDYRYENEPWKNAKGSIERAIAFLTGEEGKEPDK